MYWAIGILLLLVIGYLLDREIYFYEGVHFGPRFQSWFYDRWARKYDAGKRESQLRDDEMLARPLLERMQDIPEPFVLDFATGTGRLSYALLSRPEFRGRIVAVDISQKMLEQAAEKIRRLDTDEDFADRAKPVEFLRHLALPLPFPDATFDVACCLEVLELLPDAEAALREMGRILRPGGILLTSRGTEESGRKAKVKSRDTMTAILDRTGFEHIQILAWWKLFDRVFANKRGRSEAVGAKKLPDVLRCSACGQTQWQAARDALQCSHCGSWRRITTEGIVLD